MITEQLTQVIDMIAEKLGIAAEAVYPMLLKQAQVDVSLYRVTLWVLGISAVALVLAIAGFVVADNNCWDAMTGICIAALVIAGIVFVISGITVLFDLKTYLTALHNPDLWCVEYVAKMLR